MVDSQLIFELIDLRRKVAALESLRQEFSDVELKLRAAEQCRPHELNDFDNQNKKQYIERKAGTPPRKPKKLLKIAFPVYKSKMKEYEKKYSEYKSRYSKAEKDYYREFYAERNRIDNNEREQIQLDISILRQAYNKLELSMLDTKKAVDESALLSDKYKQTAVIDDIIEYLQDKRAEGLKEAINLYHEEQHRSRIEEFAEEQLRLMEEAAQSANEAAKYAREAAEIAEEAIDRADEAYRRADEAYEKADDAYDKAEEAYNEAERASWNS